MRRWWLTVLLAAGCAAAGPFSPVELSDPAYRDLRLLRDAGLQDRALARLRDDQALTRFECALLTTASLEDLRAQADPAALPGRRDPEVEQVVAALRRLIKQFGPEVESLGVGLDTAAFDLERLPDQVVRLRRGGSMLSRPAAGMARTGDAAASGGGLLGGPPVEIAASAGPLSLSATASPLPFESGATAADVSARLGTAMGPVEGGFSVRERQIIADELGPFPLITGHVAAADLRLRLGDHSVLVEYARSLVERRGSAVESEPSGQSFRAGYARAFGDELQVDVGFRHLTSGQSLLAAFGDLDRYPTLYGIEAGLTWRGNDFGVLSSASVLRPEDQQVGYINDFGTELFYQPTDALRLGLAYQSSVRRRLSGLEDAWRNYIRAQVVYELSSRVRADLTYYRRASDTESPGTRPEHVIGASLGIGF